MELVSAPVVLLGGEWQQQVVVAQEEGPDPGHLGQGGAGLVHGVVVGPDIGVQDHAGGHGAADRVGVEAPHGGAVQGQPAGQAGGLALGPHLTAAALVGRAKCISQTDHAPTPLCRRGEHCLDESNLSLFFRLLQDFQ